MPRLNRLLNRSSSTRDTGPPVSFWNGSGTGLSRSGSLKSISEDAPELPEIPLLPGLVIPGLSGSSNSPTLPASMASPPPMAVATPGTASGDSKTTKSSLQATSPATMAKAVPAKALKPAPTQNITISTPVSATAGNPEPNSHLGHVKILFSFNCGQLVPNVEVLMDLLMRYPPLQDIFTELLQKDSTKSSELYPVATKDGKVTDADLRAAVAKGKAITDILDPTIAYTHFRAVQRWEKDKIPHEAIRDWYIEHWCTKVAFAEEFKSVEPTQYLTALRCIHDRCHWLHTALNALLSMDRFTTPDGEMAFLSLPGKQNVGRLFMRARLIIKLHDLLFVGLRIHIALDVVKSKAVPELYAFAFINSIFLPKGVGEQCSTAEANDSLQEYRKLFLEFFLASQSRTSFVQAVEEGIGSSKWSWPKMWGALIDFLELSEEMLYHMDQMRPAALDEAFTDRIVIRNAEKKYAKNQGLKLTGSQKSKSKDKVKQADHVGSLAPTTALSKQYQKLDYAEFTKDARKKEADVESINRRRVALEDYRRAEETRLNIAQANGLFTKPKPRSRITPTPENSSDATECPPPYDNLETFLIRTNGPEVGTCAEEDIERVMAGATLGRDIYVPNDPRHHEHNERVRAEAIAKALRDRSSRDSTSTIGASTVASAIRTSTVGTPNTATQIGRTPTIRTSIDARPVTQTPATGPASFGTPALTTPKPFQG